MTARIDAIVLAGDKVGSRDVAGSSKLLLEVGGKPLLLHVVEALERVERIGRIIIIGPRDSILKVLASGDPALAGSGRIQSLEQRDTGYQNFWCAFLHALGHYESGLEYSNAAVLEKPVLVLPADIPFISVDEINEFLDSADKPDLDYGVGMTASEHLRRFYPRGNLPGIKMSYLYLRDSALRLNNLHFIRPFKVLNRAYIEQIYEFRYQREFGNIARVITDVMRTNGMGVRPVYLYMVLQLSTLFSSLGLERCLLHTRSRVSRKDMTDYASIILRARVEIIETTAGGCAVDVDNERDYHIISRRFEEYSNPAS